MKAHKNARDGVKKAKKDKTDGVKKRAKPRPVKKADATDPFVLALVESTAHILSKYQEQKGAKARGAPKKRSVKK